jgi:hypothetical protein
MDRAARDELEQLRRQLADGTQQLDVKRTSPQPTFRTAG